MAYEGKILEVFIASPSDVPEERQIVREVVTEWNVINSRHRHAVLMPVGWETHSSPALGGRPQQMINDRLLENADILVGIFWTRIGTPTGESASGTVEEIQRHHEAGKPAMLYFSTKPVAPASLDVEQFAKLQEFRKWAQSQGLVETFDAPEHFRLLLSRQLALEINGNDYLKRVTSLPLVVADGESASLRDTGLSADARELLKVMVEDHHGALMIVRYVGGTAIQAGGRSFFDGNNRRELARWEAAIETLQSRGLIRDRNGNGEYYVLTSDGYRAAEEQA